MGKLYEAIESGDREKAIALLREGHNPSDAKITSLLDEYWNISPLNSKSDKAQEEVSGHKDRSGYIEKLEVKAWEAESKRRYAFAFFDFGIDYAIHHRDFSFLAVSVSDFVSSLKEEIEVKTKLGLVKIGQYIQDTFESIAKTVNDLKETLTSSYGALKMEQERARALSGEESIYYRTERVTHLVAKTFDVEMASLLLDYGAKADLGDSYGRDMTAVAAQYSSAAMLKTIIDHPKGPTFISTPTVHALAAADPRPPFGKEAWEEEKIKKLEIILERQPHLVNQLAVRTQMQIPDVSVRTQGRTPVETALAQGNFKLAHKMIQELAKENRQLLMEAMPDLVPTVIVSWRSREQSEYAKEILKTLKEVGYDLSAKDQIRLPGSSGNNSIHLAFYLKNADAVKALIELGVNPLERNSKGERPADMRVSQSRHPVAEGNFREEAIAAGALPSTLKRGLLERALTRFADVAEAAFHRVPGASPRGEGTRDFPYYSDQAILEGVKKTLEREGPLAATALWAEHSSPRDRQFLSKVYEQVLPELVKQKGDRGQDLEL